MDNDYIKLVDHEDDEHHEHHEHHDVYSDDEIVGDMDNNTLEVKRIIEIKNILESISYTDHSSEYREIIEKVKSFLVKFCNHDKDTDLFDITPDKSITVCYCKKCYCVFT